MATLIVPDVGKLTLLDSLSGAGISHVLQNLNVHLYASAHTPVHGDTLSTYAAIEATFSGYAPQGIATWPPSGLNGSLQAESDPAAVSFSNGSGSPQNVYGVFLTDSTNAYLLEAGAFDAVIAIPSGVNLLVAISELLTSLF